MKRFKARVNDQFEFDLTQADTFGVRQNGQEVQAIDQSQLIRAQEYDADFLNRTYRYRIHGSFYEVQLKDDLDLLIDELGLAANVSTLSNELKAPMPGLIVDVLVKQGDAVKQGDGLIVLEAMKMENKLIAAHDGVIGKTIVKPGDAVEKGSVLIEFENNENNQ